MANIIVSDKDLSALFQSADQKSRSGQTTFLRVFRLRIGGLLIAAVGGAISAKLGEVELGGLIALVAFVTALGAEMFLLITKPEKLWYEGRAAAESAKTLAWRYMVHGESFESTIPDPEALLLGEYHEILNDLDAVQIPTTGGSEITSRMREVRETGFPVRREIYRRDRVRKQRDWYAENAQKNLEYANRWTAATVGLECLGILGGALRAFGGVHVDLLGILAAATVAIAAWVQAKQHQTLSTAYSIASQELSTIYSNIELVVEEAGWAQFVGEAEEAISREHTLWRASRGLRIKPSRPLS